MARKKATTDATPVETPAAPKRPGTRSFTPASKGTRGAGTVEPGSRILGESFKNAEDIAVEEENKEVAASNERLVGPTEKHPRNMSFDELHSHITGLKQKIQDPQTSSSSVIRLKKKLMFAIDHVQLPGMTSNKERWDAYLQHKDLFDGAVHGPCVGGAADCRNMTEDVACHDCVRKASVPDASHAVSRTIALKSGSTEEDLMRSGAYYKDQAHAEKLLNKQESLIEKHSGNIAAAKKAIDTHASIIEKLGPSETPEANEQRTLSTGVIVAAEKALNKSRVAHAAARRRARFAWDHLSRLGVAGYEGDNPHGVDAGKGGRPAEFTKRAEAAESQSDVSIPGVENWVPKAGEVPTTASLTEQVMPSIGLPANTVMYRGMQGPIIRQAVDSARQARIARNSRLLEFNGGTESGK